MCTMTACRQCQREEVKKRKYVMSLHVHFLSLSICLFPVLTASDIKLLHADALAILSAAENKLPAIGNDIMSHSYQCYM